MLTLPFISPAVYVGAFVRNGVLSKLFDSASAVAQTGVGILRLPFDTVRAQYARGVQVGLIKRSMLASRDFEHALGALERLTLGPLARRI